MLEAMHICSDITGIQIPKITANMPTNQSEWVNAVFFTKL